MVLLRLLGYSGSGQSRGSAPPVAASGSLGSLPTGHISTMCSTLYHSPFSISPGCPCSQAQTPTLQPEGLGTRKQGFSKLHQTLAKKF